MLAAMGRPISLFQLKRQVGNGKRIGKFPYSILMSKLQYLSNFFFAVDFSLRALLSRNCRVAGDKYFKGHLDDGSARFAIRVGLTEARVLNIFRRYLERVLHLPHIGSRLSCGVI